jgi:anti-anti-sigma factor
LDGEDGGPASLCVSRSDFGHAVLTLVAPKRVNAMELLVVNRDVRPEAVVVRAKGEVDSSTAAEFTARLNAALNDAANQPSRLLIIDLQALTYFGSAGLNAVLDCHRQGLKAGTSVRLVADNGLVVRPIEVTNLDTVLKLYRTLGEALEGRDPKKGS